MSQMIRILGIDPGLRHTGWGIIEQTGARLVHVAHGVIEPDPKQDLAVRLADIFSAVTAVIEEYSPHASGVEETLVNAGFRNALKLGQARGAAMAALARSGLRVAEFAPRKIKLAVVGTGGADKTQIEFMVKRLLPRAGEMSSDAADALACAICTATHMPLELKRGAA